MEGRATAGKKHDRTVVIADDHAVVRLTVRQLIEALDDVEIVAEAENGLAAIAAAKAHKPSMIVLDAAMPLARGIEVYAEVRRWAPSTRVVLLTGFTSRSLLADWLNSGVDGLLLKSCPLEEMAACFETVLAGGRFIAAEAADAVGEENGDGALTNREREVLALIIAGGTNDTIADRLCLSPKTVEKHRGSLMAKLGVHSVSGLMAYAVREGLLDELKQL